MARFRSGAPGVRASFGKLPRPPRARSSARSTSRARGRSRARSRPPRRRCPVMPASAARCAGTERLVTTLSPDHRLALELRSDARDDRGEVAVGGRQVVVLGQLDARAAVADGVVADGMREERPERVVAQEEREPVAAPLVVGSQHGAAVGRVDQPALDLELPVHEPRVVAPRRERVGRPDLPVRGQRDQHREADGEEAKQRGDLAVHARSAARFDTMRRSASMMKFETIDEPP